MPVIGADRKGGSMVNLEVIQKALAAHGSWKARLRQAIGSGKFEVGAETVKLDNQCEFGKWLYGTELSAVEKQTEHYVTVKKLHAQFHQEAAKVVELATSGQKDKAEAAIGLSGSYGQASHALTEAMVKWRGSLE
ncbi:MAG TPA: CZB domain-containing protein [Methylomirabilota bacterium]|nr:CZB domain-containing protein [Methylomirabilota bacterium]